MNCGNETNPLHQVSLGAPPSVAADLSIATYFCPWDEAAVKTQLCVGPGVAFTG